MSLENPLRQVLGTGSAKSGVEHWWRQRLTSLALVPLTVWFVVSLLALPSLDHDTVISWMRHSSTTLPLILLLLVGAWHSQLGLRVIVEDYVHDPGTRTLTLVVFAFVNVLAAAAGMFAVLKVAFGGAA